MDKDNRNINNQMDEPKLELEWDFDSDNEQPDILTLRDISDIHSDLKQTVMDVFKGDILSYQKLDLVSMYRMVFETVEFLFEDHRKNFETSKRELFFEEMNDDQLQVETTEFCSWLSIEVMSFLSNQTFN